MVTIRDVAREAGVSVATVSRVFNDSGPVSERARRRVREVAQVLRYTPHGAARSLITAKTSTLGVLLPDLYGEFFSEVIRGIDQRAKLSRYHLLVSGMHDARSDLEAALRAMRGRVDGLIVMWPEVDARVLVENLSDDLPVVLLNCPPHGAPFDALSVDNFGGAYAMTRHLLGLGHRRIALIRGAEHNHDATERRRGYRAALRDAGVKLPGDWEARGDFTEESGHHAIARLLDLAPRPTAIFAANDAMAIGALSALRDAGVSVPHQMAVAGFDDIPTARYLNPPLSSMHVPIAELGERAMDILLERLAHDNGATRSESRRETVKPTLVVRRSCGARAGGVQ